MKVKSESEVAQSCPTLCDPVDCSLPGSSVHGIFQARVLEWGAIAFSETLALQLSKYFMKGLEELLLYTHVIPGLGRSPGGGHGNPLQYSFFSLSFKNLLINFLVYLFFN